MGKPKRKRVKCWEVCLLPEYRVIAENGCWIWTGRLNAYGYPQFRRNKKEILITRFALETVRGEPLGDLDACHHCDNPPCFNPDHLFAGTHKENMDDMNRKIQDGRRPPRKNPITAGCYKGNNFKNPNFITPIGQSGIRGVQWSNGPNTWKVMRKLSGKEICYGSFKNLADAIVRNDEVNACLTPP